MPKSKPSEVEIVAMAMAWRADAWRGWTSCDPAEEFSMLGLEERRGYRSEARSFLRALRGKP